MESMYMIRLFKEVAMKPPHVWEFEGNRDREQPTIQYWIVGHARQASRVSTGTCIGRRKPADRQRPDFGVGVSAEG